MSETDLAEDDEADAGILILDDSPHDVRTLSELLAGRDHRVRPFTEAPLAIRSAVAAPPDLILLDVNMPGMNGFEVATELVTEPATAEVPILFISAESAPETRVQAFRSGGVDYITKPFHDDEVMARVTAHLGLRVARRMLENANRKLEQRVAERTWHLEEAMAEIQFLKDQAEAENVVLRERLGPEAEGEIIGDSAPMRALREQIAAVAPTDATVLIVGESGTGKELVARAVHAASGRAGHPLVSVNCAAVPKDLFESEFFGHTKGAFTGATADRDGRFALAEGGTLFLDEIGEVPLKLQSKLLRVLQDRTYERVGDGEPREADVRIVAATNRDLRAEVEEGRFREDLYYRLNVFPIQLAPLRQRGEDVALLANHFLEQFLHRFGVAPVELTTTQLAQLQGYAWPGNIRELQNALERFAIQISAGQEPAGLVLITAPVATSSPSASEPPDSPAAARVLTAAELRAFEADNLRRALRESGGKIYGKGGAAEKLAMKPTTVSSRVRALGIDPRSASVRAGDESS